MWHGLVPWCPTCMAIVGKWEVPKGAILSVTGRERVQEWGMLLGSPLYSLSEPVAPWQGLRP